MTDIKQINVFDFIKPFTEKENILGSLSGKKIWFLDHEDNFLDDLRKGLAKYVSLQKQIEISTNPNHVYDIAINSREIDILISDYKMPDLNGVEFLRKIRENNQEIILVIYSGFAISSDSKEDRVCKKYDIERLHKTFDSIDNLVTSLAIYVQKRMHINQEVVYEKKYKLFNWSNEETGREPIEIDLLSNQIYEKSDELKELVLDLASDLLLDLEQIEDKSTAIIHVGDRQISVDDLKRNISELSPLGREYLTEWFKAEKKLRRIKK